MCNMTIYGTKIYGASLDTSNTTSKFHYVYRITDLTSNEHYYGKRSSKTNPYEDLGSKYFSSSTVKGFKNSQLANPLNYKYKVVRVYSSAKEALELEVKLHEKFDVGRNESFINKVKQSSSGFSTNGMTPVRDVATNKIVMLSVDDPRILSGELTGVNKGITEAIDLSSGDFIRVDRENPPIGTFLFSRSAHIYFYRNKFYTKNQILKSVGPGNFKKYNSKHGLILPNGVTISASKYKKDIHFDFILLLSNKSAVDFHVDWVEPIETNGWSRGPDGIVRWIGGTPEDSLKYISNKRLKSLENRFLEIAQKAAESKRRVGADGKTGYQKAAESRKKSLHESGKVLTISIYNADGEHVITCVDNFAKWCKETGAPYDAILRSKGKPIYSSKIAKSKIKGTKSELYIGWYSIIEVHIHK